MRGGIAIETPSCEVRFSSSHVIVMFVEIQTMSIRAIVCLGSTNFIVL